MARLNQSERDRLNREIGIRDKRIQTMEQTIHKLQEWVDRSQQILDYDHALITAVIKATGTICISQDDINDILEKHIQTTVKTDDTGRIFTLSVEDEKQENV